MFKYTKSEIVTIAKENNFLVNNTEKVLRLSTILNHLAQTTYGKYLALKGGTAINLFLLDLPRLSVDIDFDFSMDCSKDEMMIAREIIRKDINAFMIDDGYLLSDKSKFVHTLDSFIFFYFTTSGSKDVLKIEINYSNRIHILPTIFDKRAITLGETISTIRLSDTELIGSKINALIVRTTPRDFYDTYNIFKNGVGDLNLIKKIAIFYSVLGSDIPVDFNKIFNNCIETIELFNYNKLRDTLIPVLHKEEKLNIDQLKLFMLAKLKEMFILDNSEKKYIEKFNSGIFDQDLLFDDLIKTNLNNHPMVLWKTKNLTWFQYALCIKLKIYENCALLHYVNGFKSIQQL